MIADWQAAADCCMAGGQHGFGKLPDCSDDELLWQRELPASSWEQDEHGRCTDPVGDQLDDDNMSAEVDAWWDASEASLQSYELSLIHI